MRKYSILTLVMLTLAVLLASRVRAQNSMEIITVALAHGQVDVLGPNGNWAPLTKPLTATEGITVRTHPNSEVTTRFADGSTLTLGPESGLRFVSVGSDTLQAKVVGDVKANLSPQVLASRRITLDYPTARINLNRQDATARVSLSSAVAARVSLNTTQLAGRVVLNVDTGVALIDSLLHINGHISAIDKGQMTLTLRDGQTGGEHQVHITDQTQIASARYTRLSRQDLLNALKKDEHLVAYGNGPKGADVDDLERGAGGPGPINATVLYLDVAEGGAPYVDMDRFLGTPLGDLSGESLPIVGPGSAELGPGQQCPWVVPTNLPPTALGIPGVGLVALGGVLADFGLHHTGTTPTIIFNPPPTPTPTPVGTGTVSRPRLEVDNNRMKQRLGLSPPTTPVNPRPVPVPPHIAPPHPVPVPPHIGPHPPRAALVIPSSLTTQVLSQVMPGPVGASLQGFALLHDDNNPGRMAGSWKFAKQWGMHFAVTNQPGVNELDMGIEYGLHKNMALGFGVRHVNVGFFGAQFQFDEPQVRMQVRY